MSVTETILGSLSLIFSKVFGSANERQLKRLWPMVEQVKKHYPATVALNDADFPRKTDELRRRFCRGESLDSLLFEAFSLCREASHRTLGKGRILFDKWRKEDIRYFGHFDVQILGGIVLHEGRIAEMVTGEGKTLVASLPAYLNGLAVSEKWIAASREVQGEDIDRWKFVPLVRTEPNGAWILASSLSASVEPLRICEMVPLGRGVHIITVNDYLAGRDCEDNRPLFEFLGLTVGCIQSNMSSEERIPMYMCDITYGTNNEFGFDYLRDNLKVDAHQQVQRSRAYAIIDEVDSVLIDEARTPLIISGSAESATDKYYAADRIVKKLVGRHQNDVDDAIMEAMKSGWQREEARMKAEEGVDYIFSERDRSAKMTEQGQNRILQLLGIEDLYAGKNLDWLHHMNNALAAHSVWHVDQDYVVKDGQVIIVDSFTGRLMEGRRWSDGLHQAIEAKEHLKIKEESQTIATITFQNFFKLYDKLSGMTGTAMTEAREFFSIYGLDPVSIPTNRPLLRNNLSDLIYGTDREKYTALVEHVAEVHAMGRPILVGTVSIERSELISELLRRRGIPHEVLNAKQHAREAEIVKDAGQFARVTIATNMAGRGTDIKLGIINLEEAIPHWQRWKLCPKSVKPTDSREAVEASCLPLWAERWLPEEALTGKTHDEWRAMLAMAWKENALHPLVITGGVAELGGLHVVGTERHESRRIDNQLRGRCARQGDPGSSRFFLSLEDDLMRIFAPDRVKALLQRLGLSDGMPLEHGMVSRSIERAQRKVEERNFEIRKNLLEYDGVRNEQRLIVYERRQKWLEAKELAETVEDFLADAVGGKVQQTCGAEMSREEWDLAALSRWCSESFLLEVSPPELEASAGPNLTGIQPFLEEKVLNFYRERVRRIGEETQRQIEKYLLLQTLDRKWMDHLYAMDLMKESIHLRSYAQQDPKIVYKREGYEMFEELWDGLRDEIVNVVLRIQPAKEEELELREVASIDTTIHEDFGTYQATSAAAGANVGEVHHDPFVREEEKVSRNAPCPCGSGQKYKKCHGR